MPSPASYLIKLVSGVLHVQILGRHAGTWWADPAMRRKYIITADGTLCILGFFPVLVVAVDPVSIKVILGGALLYALVRLTWAFWQA